MEQFMNQKEYKLSWLKILGVVALIGLIALIIYLVYPKKEDDKVLSTYNNNLKLMKEAGREYFKGSNLPSKIGESKELSLEDMLSSKLIVDILDEKGNSCDLDKSYIRATKEKDNEYSLKVALTCENKSDYIITSIVTENSSSDNLNNDQNNPSNPTTNNVTDNSNNNTSSNNNSNNSNSNSNSNNQGNSTDQNKTPVVQHVTNYNITYADGCNCNNNNCNNCTNKVYHSVYFESNGGSYVARQVVEDGKTAEYRSTSKDGYKFIGWYTDNSFTTLYNFTEPVTKQITLYAKWEKINSNNPSVTTEYTVTFDPQNGNNIITKKVTKGALVSSIEDPTKYCAKFLGWYLNGIKYDFNTPVNGDITLVARYEENVCRDEYIVQFDSNGGTTVASRYVYAGNLVSKPINPTRTGYKFIGWYYNNKEFDFNTPIYQNYTLIAKWEAINPLYSTYCKMVTETYYSVSYVTGDQKTTKNSWTIKFNDIKNTDNLKITEVGYLNSLTDYNNLYNKYVYNKGVGMVGDNKKNDVSFTSGYMLRTYSLKSTNFTKSLSEPYFKNGYWYTDAVVNIRNYNNTTSYYADNIKQSIYFVPFYYKVKYTDFNSCVEDLADNWFNYPGYEIVSSYYK